MPFDTIFALWLWLSDVCLRNIRLGLLLFTGSRMCCATFLLLPAQQNDWLVVPSVCSFLLHEHYQFCGKYSHPIRSNCLGSNTIGAMCAIVWLFSQTQSARYLTSNRPSQRSQVVFHELRTLQTYSNERSLITNLDEK